MTPKELDDIATIIVRKLTSDGFFEELLDDALDRFGEKAEELLGEHIKYASKSLEDHYPEALERAQQHQQARLAYEKLNQKPTRRKRK